MPRDYLGEGVQAAINMFLEAIAMAMAMTVATEVLKQILGPQEAFIIIAVIGIALVFDTADTMRRMKYWPTKRLLGAIITWALLLILVLRAMGPIEQQDFITEFKLYLIYALFIIATRFMKQLH